MATQSRYITRKEIANANEVSERTIRRREQNLGLDKCRDEACEKPARYDRHCAEQELRRRNYRVPD